MLQTHLSNHVDVLLPSLQLFQRRLEVCPRPLEDKHAEVAENVVDIADVPDLGRRNRLDEIRARKEHDLGRHAGALGGLDATADVVDFPVEMVQDALNALVSMRLHCRVSEGLTAVGM